jgi:hypothetical protein
MLHHSSLPVDQNGPSFHLEMHPDQLHDQVMIAFGYIGILQALFLDLHCIFQGTARKEFLRGFRNARLIAFINSFASNLLVLV